MLTVAEAVQQITNDAFDNDDLFDAELDSEGERGGESLNGLPEGDVNWEGEGVDNEDASSDDEEDNVSRKKKKKQQRKERPEPRRRSPRPRKLKKQAIKSIHSETQRMIRESSVTLPYHQPVARPITHFLKRIHFTAVGSSLDQVTKSGKSDMRTADKKHDAPQNRNCETECTESEQNPTQGSVNGLTSLKNGKPKLSDAVDPFFLDGPPKLPGNSAPVNAGVHGLMQRFMKHTSRPAKKRDKVRPEAIKKISQEPQKEILQKSAKVIPLTTIPENSLEAKAPGGRLRALKEQLEQKMKLKRAERRELQEAQRKIDNEEITDEEEAEMTEAEDESDVDDQQWNEDDEAEMEQESGPEDVAEEEESIRNEFVDDEADETDGDADDEDNDDLSDIESRDQNEDDEPGTDNSNEENATFAGVKVDLLPKKTGPAPDEQTIELFNSDTHSKSQGTEDGSEQQGRKAPESNDFGDLRFKLHSDNKSKFPSSFGVTTKTTDEFNSGTALKNPAPNTADLSSESNQSGHRTISELGESWNSFQGSDGSRIPPGQGEGSDKKSNTARSTAPLTPFSKLQSLFGGTAQVTDDSFKKDLFDDESTTCSKVDSNSDSNVHDAGEGPASSFHFSLDEDTQFTQILDTQGYLCSSKKKKKPPKLFNFDTEDSNMEELLGLCSGKFLDQKDTGQDSRKRPESFPSLSMLGDNTQGTDMDEVLGLCSGKFTAEAVKENDQNCGENEPCDNGGMGAASSRADSVFDELELKVAVDSESEEEEGAELELKSRKRGKEKREVFNKRNFLEEEAELSGSDVGSDDEEDDNTENDTYDEESNDEELPSDEEMQKQINKVHMKNMLDQDKADIRMVKELLLPDGDLYSDGQGRTRNFKWYGIDESSQLDLFDKGLWGDEHVGPDNELATEEETQRRKERFEREAFLQEENSKKNKDEVVNMDEGSQHILSIIKDTSKPKADVSAAKQPPLKVTKPGNSVKGPALKRTVSQRGSFLNRSKDKLSHLANLTSSTPNLAGSARHFVFQAVSPGAKTNQRKKPERSQSFSEPMTTSKRRRLDNSINDMKKQDSVFSKF